MIDYDKIENLASVEFRNYVKSAVERMEVAWIVGTSMVTESDDTVVVDVMIEQNLHIFYYFKTERDYSRMVVVGELVDRYNAVKNGDDPGELLIYQ